MELRTATYGGDITSKYVINKKKLKSIFLNKPHKTSFTSNKNSTMYKN